MKKLILLLSFLLLSSNAFAAYTLVLTEQKVGKYKNSQIIPEENPKLFQHRIKINETFQTAHIIEQTNPFNQTKLEQLNDKYVISYIDAGLPPGTKEKSICLTRNLPLATEVILVNHDNFQFISIHGDEIIMSEGIVQMVSMEDE